MIPTLEFLADVKLIELETTERNGQCSAVGCFSQSSFTTLYCVTDGSKGPWCTAIQLPSFSFCDCNESTLRKAILIFVCFYFKVITIVGILLFLLMFFVCFVSADDYLNAKKQYDENGKKKKKKNLNIWYVD